MITILFDAYIMRIQENKVLVVLKCHFYTRHRTVCKRRSMYTKHQHIVRLPLLLAIPIVSNAYLFILEALSCTSKHHLLARNNDCEMSVIELKW